MGRDVHVHRRERFAMQIREIDITQSARACMRARARASSQVASRFRCNVVARSAASAARARAASSPVMLLAASVGTTVRVEIDGPDELAAMTPIASLLGDDREQPAVARCARTRGRAMVSFALHGIGVSGGIAIGRAQLVSHATLEVAHYTIPPSQVDAEIARFERRGRRGAAASSKACTAR